MTSDFQNVDVYTFHLKEAQDWLRVRGRESKGSNFPDAVRRVRDEEYSTIMEDCIKAGILPCDSFVSSWNPFQAIAENAEMVVRQALSWVSYSQGSCSAWGLSAHVSCAAGVRIDNRILWKNRRAAEATRICMYRASGKWSILY